MVISLLNRKSFHFFVHSFSQVYDGMSTSYTINKLNELTPYCCRIRSKNDAGEGDFSQPKIFYTKARPPQPIKGKNSIHENIQLTDHPADFLATVV